MKPAALGLVLAMGLAGCVVAPLPPPAVPVYGYTQPVAPGPGVVYMAPAYPAPSVGFVWALHPRMGWGWVHRSRGWHRGWR
jgi:hypothetical protein